ncbi:MAG: ABC transporter permease [candidate division WOR-3 bacterium]|nr:MAG: ABC transporter permease [candidate division WOR-3 bacterium]
MKILHLAWRNVFRHTRRTLITASAISVGLSAMILSNTMMNGADKMASENIIQYETGHMQIFAKGYYREEGIFPLDTIIEEPETIIQHVRTHRNVAGVTERVKFQARVNNGVDELPTLAYGIDIENDSEVFRIAQSVVDGAFLKEREDILIGTDLARDMGFAIGSYLTVITKDRYGTYNANDFFVSGLINTTHPLFDRNAVLMKLEVAQQLLDLDHGVTEICVRVRNSAQLASAQRDITALIGAKYEVYTWRELNAAIFEISGFKRLSQFMIALVVLIIAAVGIVNTMLMAVMERIPEIGTLKAMGFRNNSIVQMFVLEGGIIGAFGSLLGCIFGVLMSLYVAIQGLDFSQFFGDMDVGYPIKMIIKGEIDFLTILLVFLFGVVVTILVSLWPVRMATRLEPVDALRHV